jgi:hypothetical protein
MSLGEQNEVVHEVYKIRAVKPRVSGVDKVQQER